MPFGEGGPELVARWLCAACTLAGLMALIHGTSLGRAMRATAENPKVAQLMGVRPDRVISATFVIGAALAVVAAFLAASYPYTKRFLALPQAYLGIAFGFGIPMGYAAVLGTVPLAGWVMLAANIAWAIAYDTEYAMVDRDDDLRIGIRDRKSTRLNSSHSSVSRMPSSA